MTRISKANDAVQAEIGGAEPGSYYSCLAWITKKKRVRLDPSEIVFISQRNYNAWYRSGKLIVESVKGKFTLSMVADVDGARRRLELARSSDAAVLVPVESEDE